MLDFISSLFKQRPSTKGSTPVPTAEKTENKQKWNPKLGVYDTPLSGCEQVVFHGAGMEHHMDELMELAEENLDFTCTKKELRDYLIINQRVFQYKFNPTGIDLVPDPQNPYDSNAVKILLNNRHIGYIRSSQAQRSADLFNSDRVKRVQVSIQGGKYKILLGDGSYFDGSEPLSEFKLTQDEAPYSVRIYLDVESI